MAASDDVVATAVMPDSVDDRSAIMAASDDVAAAAVKPDSVDDLDVRDLDLDFDFGDLDADEFCDAYSTFIANADAKRDGGAGTGGGWLAGLSCCGGGEGSREGSPDSVVTTDGRPLAAAAGDEAMSAFVSELERYLMQDDGDIEEGVFCADGDRVEEHICVVDDFFGDLLQSSDFGGIVTAAAGALHDGSVQDNDGDVLAAREDEPASRKRARVEKPRDVHAAQWISPYAETGSSTSGSSSSS